MTKKEFIQQCCIHSIHSFINNGFYSTMEKVEDVAKELERRGYRFDKEDDSSKTIIDISEK